MAHKNRHVLRNFAIQTIDWTETDLNSIQNLTFIQKLEVCLRSFALCITETDHRTEELFLHLNRLRKLKDFDADQDFRIHVILDVKSLFFCGSNTESIKNVVIERIENQTYCNYVPKLLNYLANNSNVLLIHALCYDMTSQEEDLFTCYNMFQYFNGGVHTNSDRIYSKLKSYNENSKMNRGRTIQASYGTHIKPAISTILKLQRPSSSLPSASVVMANDYSVIEYIEYTTPSKNNHVLGIHMINFIKDNCLFRKEYSGHKMFELMNRLCYQC